MSGNQPVNKKLSRGRLDLLTHLQETSGASGISIGFAFLFSFQHRMTSSLTLWDVSVKEETGVSVV